MTIQQIQSQVLDIIDLTIRPLQSSAYSSTCREAILRNAIANAMRWLAMVAPPDILDGTDTVSTPTGFLADNASSILRVGNVLTMPGNFVRLARVILPSWQRAVREAIDDTSDRALMVRDIIAKATTDRPVAVLASKTAKTITLYPAESAESPGAIEAAHAQVQITTVMLPATISTILSGTATDVALPPKATAPLLYQAAGYTLASMRDPDAKIFFDIAASFLTRPQTP